MKEVLNFLTELSTNNNKPWFDAHKAEYLVVKSQFEEYAQRLISGIGEFDESVRNLQVKSCTYRIYRDLRFSVDKSPYKSYMAVFTVREGKNSAYAGYYLHIQPSGESFLWAGLHMPQPAIVRSVREEISLDGNLFVDAVSKAKGFVLDTSDSLKRVPYDYPADSVYADYLKLKSFGVMMPINREFMLSDNFINDVLAHFKTTYEFVTLLNRSVDYAKEMF